MKLELTNATKLAVWTIGNAAMEVGSEINGEQFEEISLNAINEALEDNNVVERGQDEE